MVCASGGGGGGGRRGVDVVQAPCHPGASLRC